MEMERGFYPKLDASKLPTRSHVAKANQSPNLELAATPDILTQESC